MPRRRKPNIVLIGIDSLRADHLSCYGYPRLTSPYIDRFAQGGTLFEKTYSPYIPTTSGYGSMLTGMDVFNTQMVALRHQGPLRPKSRRCRKYLKQPVITRHVWVSGVIRHHAGLIPILILLVGVAGTKDAVPKHKT